MTSWTHLDQVRITQLPESVDVRGETRIPPSPLG